ncbi:MAG: ABC transporter ATP-binding protein [Firmicutes bacterium]|jgi:ABC-type sugar transport system ATPase subunit|uniref:ABC transporter domain-containing protein n=1 Tax=Sulfobacillus benefaciens TaxID=453960 RepID=A0A2T2X9I3_9FIRM|nr:ABC transporter ATP-binding protein [Bacillota bacterium]MCL5013152.1 ABC transporter ATP-binding protein [Bacillota bacterium]PSR31145.1 MAG: hypothetical protein C7B43_03345 [Sulfobacillus benefaciens]
MASIEFRNVSKMFGSQRVLAPTHLGIPNGEFFTVVGPSGSGKSTLLRLIAGLEVPSTGEILFDGERVDNKPAYSRNVGMVFQNYAIYPHMTISQNMSFGLEAQKIPKAQINQKVKEVAKILEIDGLLAKRPGQLSGGQKQRVALGRALVRNPRVFLMDEPLSNLDTQLRERMRKEIRLLHETFQITTVYVTHDQTEAMTMADRICVVNGGEIQQIGTPEDIYQHPANIFVAKFFGSPAMNVIAGRLVPYKETLAFEPEHDPERLSPLPADLAARGREHVLDGPVFLGFRPEAVGQETSGTAWEIPFVPVTIESLGSHYQIHGQWCDQPISLSTSIRPVRERHKVLNLLIPWTDVHWFYEDGSRINFAAPVRVRQEA